MKNAIILHGGPARAEYYDPKMPSMSDSHWIPWLQAQLLKNTLRSEIHYARINKYELYNF